MPVFSSKMTLFGKAGLYTIIGMVSMDVWTPEVFGCLLNSRAIPIGLA